MKKIILSAVVLTGLTMAGFSQGVIYFDGSNNTSTSPTATSSGSVFFNSVLDTATDINVALMYGSSASDVSSAVVTLLLSSSATTANSAPGGIQPASGDISFFGSGVLLDNSGVGYQLTGTSAGATEFFQVLAWTGNYSSYAAAMAAGATDSSILIGQSSVFSEILASATGVANDISGMSALNLKPVPEPTTMALVGLGGLALLAFRRKK